MKNSIHFHLCSEHLKCISLHQERVSSLLLQCVLLNLSAMSYLKYLVRSFYKSSFNSKCLFYKNYNRFWVIQNSKTLIGRLKELNKKCNAKTISTFDFSTLYTKPPHADLLRVLNELIEFVFNSGRKTTLLY